MIKRRKTKTVKVGSVKIGSRHPISIQSMTKTNTEDVRATVRQIKGLEQAGCEIVRVAVKDIDSARSLDRIKAKINIPLVADIHFNYRLGLEAIERGADALRLNPGNIYRREEVRQIAQAARRKKIPIRVGVNSGSLHPTSDIRHPTTKKDRKKNMPDLMVKSALNYIKMLESANFYDIIVSLKASDVATTVSAYRRLVQLCNYPFHLGITACGLLEDGVVKSALGLGSLLLDGIGDTIRVSLTASPLEEIKAGKQILQALGLRYFAPEIIACPTCGRTQADVVKITREVRKRLSDVPPTPRLRGTGRCPMSDVQPLKVAIMGCEVNGPGEAREADLGVACGKNSVLLFKQGEIVRRIREIEIADTLIKEIKTCSGVKV